jgi:hypothetical protein
MTADMAFECLFVSRDPGVFGTINRILEQLSICTNLCLSPSRAFEILKRGSTDLVVIDWDGDPSSELLQEMRKGGKWRKPTVVAITSNDCLVPGAHVVLKKPVTVDAGKRSLKSAYSRMLQDYRLHARHALMTSVMATTEDRRTFSAIITDIGDGGVGLSTKQELVIGDVLSFRVLLPGTQRQILLYARVLWTREYGRAGCEFVRIPPVDLNVLHDWLKSELRVKKPVSEL